MLDRHCSISGVASEVSAAAGSGVSEEGRPFDEDRPSGDGVEELSLAGTEFAGPVRVTFIHSSLGVTSNMAVTSKKSSKLSGRPLCIRWGLLVPSRKRGSRIFNCGGARCMAGSRTATGPLTVCVVHYRERYKNEYTRI